MVSPIKQSEGSRQSHGFSPFRDSGELLLEVSRAQCPLLQQYEITSVGLAVGELPESIGSQCYTVVVCLEGIVSGSSEGGIKKGDLVLVDRQSFCALGYSGKYCWVSYENRYHNFPQVDQLTGEAIARLNCLPIETAIRGLAEECRGEDIDADVNRWVHLIHRYVTRAIGGQRVDKFAHVWEVVKRQLDYPWTLQEIASMGGMSGEHMRRLCKKHLGCAPMQYVTLLRMQRASVLLSSTDEKIETVSRSVGYSNAYTFSNSFKGWCGVRPSKVR